MVQAQQVGKRYDTLVEDEPITIPDEDKSPSIASGRHTFISFLYPFRRWLCVGLTVGGFAVMLFVGFSRDAAHPETKATTSTPSAAPTDTAFSAGRFYDSPGVAEEDACRHPLPDSDVSSEDQDDPAVEAASPGKRVRMKPFQGMEYQLFLPKEWTDGTDKYPVVVFLHGAGDGKFSVMNSQSLPRLLAKNQSTCFDDRSCWCLGSEYVKVRAQREAPGESSLPFLKGVEELHSPLADCDFADTFPAIVIMPQGWLPDHRTGWTTELLVAVEALTRSTLSTYRGDPQRVILTGQSAGGGGVWHFASLRPELWAAVNVICMPAPPDVARSLEGINLWVVGWTGDGELGNDDIVRALKMRTRGSVRYTRYLEAPGPPDPRYRIMLNHASYDLIYRDPRLWKWAFSQRNVKAASLWP